VWSVRLHNHFLASVPADIHDFHHEEVDLLKRRLAAKTNPRLSEYLSFETE